MRKALSVLVIVLVGMLLCGAFYPTRLSIPLYISAADSELAIAALDPAVGETRADPTVLNFSWHRLNLHIEDVVYAEAKRVHRLGQSQVMIKTWRRLEPVIGWKDPDRRPTKTETPVSREALFELDKK